MPDRLAERQEIVRLLDAGRSIQMPAPRRVGKTWLMHKAAEDLATSKWVTIFVDAEGMRSEDELLKALCREIQSAASIKESLFSQLTHRLKQLSISGWDGNPLTAIGRIDATWEEHLDKNFIEPERGNLFAVLEVCCKQSEGETFATLQSNLGATHKSLQLRELKDLLTILANDGFLHEVAERWQFRSGLLRRYWMKYWHA